MLIDSERDSENAILEDARKGFIKACEKVGIPCHVLKYRAMENYLSDGAIKKVKGNNYAQLSPYEKLLPRTHGWGKSENWKIAREMSKSELESTDLGQFISGL